MTDTKIIKAEGYFHQRCGEKGGVTAGWVRDYENEEFIFSFAVCHPDDLYNKKVGRELVDNRLASHGRYTFKLDFITVISGYAKAVKGSDVVEDSVVDAMLSEIQFADVKTKFLVRVADSVSYFLMENPNADINKLFEF